MTSNQTPDLINLLFTVGKMLKEKFKQDGVNGITFSQVKTLHFIEGKKNLTMKELADELNITPPSVTSLIDPFVLHGLVKRVYDPSDRRIVRLALTAKGKTYLTEHYKTMKQKMEKLVANLNQQQIDNLKEILETLLKNSKE